MMSNILRELTHENIVAHNGLALIILRDDESHLRLAYAATPNSVLQLTTPNLEIPEESCITARILGREEVGSKILPTENRGAYVIGFASITTNMSGRSCTAIRFKAFLRLLDPPLRSGGDGLQPRKSLTALLCFNK